MRVAQVETERDSAKTTAVHQIIEQQLLEDWPEVLRENAAHQREIVNGVMRLGPADLTMVTDRASLLLELLHLRGLQL